nr:MbeB family mobilization protein [Salmonella enterica]
MSNLLQTGAEFEKKLKERAESTEKMLNRRVQEARRICKRGCDIKPRRKSETL